jgi:hypothetical protein
MVRGPKKAVIASEDWARNSGAQRSFERGVDQLGDPTFSSRTASLGRHARASISPARTSSGEHLVMGTTGADRPERPKVADWLQRCALHPAAKAARELQR